MQTWLSSTHVFNMSTAECVASLSNGRPAIGDLVSHGASPVIDVLSTSLASHNMGNHLLFQPFCFFRLYYYITRCAFTR